MAQRTEDSRAVEAFQTYIQTRTDHPCPDYGAGVAFLTQYADTLGLSPYTTELEGSASDKPIFALVFPGEEKDAAAVLLNSHMDVVTADEACWSVDPFGGEVVDDAVYGRGTQDMKCVTIQQMEALSRLVARGWTPVRTVILSVVPDEEIGGVDGMASLLDFSLALETPLEEREAVVGGHVIGFALDEGLANPEPAAFTAFYGERAPYFVDVTATGETGHGSRFVANTAMEKLIAFANTALAYRAQQEEILHHSGGSCEGKKLGDVLTLNLTILRAGSLHNVVPTSAYAGLDIRIPPTMTRSDLEALLDQWTEAEGLSYSFKYASPESKPTLIANSPWFKAFSSALADASTTVDLEIFPAATDSRYIRALNCPCIGFSPISGTPILLHDNDEHLPIPVFLDGIRIYEQVISALSDVPVE